MVAPHFREVSLPQPSSGQLQDSTRLRSPNEVLEGLVHGGGKGSLTTQPGGLFQQFLIKHKIRTFHVYIVPKRETQTQTGGPVSLDHRTASTFYLYKTSFSANPLPPNTDFSTRGFFLGESLRPPPPPRSFLQENIGIDSTAT